MKKILINYNFTPEKDWIGDDYLIYDRSDDGIDHLTEFDPTKIIKTENIGQVDFDKLNYIIDNYYNLPEVFLWGKTNLFKYISKEEYEKVKDNQVFTPLLTRHHKESFDNLGAVSYYSGDVYLERNPLLYMSNWKYCRDYPAFAQMFGLPNPDYIPFAPGGNYILTKERVHRYAVDFYEKMASLLPYCQQPLEAHLCERAYYTLWK
jgi:hypothetical protein